MTTPARELEVLLVEDDVSLREVLQLHLAAEGWSVRVAGDFDEAMRAADAHEPDVAVLDVMLPGRSGLEICATLRARSPTPGIVMLTARSEEADVVLGLEVGADDYVIKPCRPREVVARVRAVMRRVRGAATTPTRKAPIVRVRGRLAIDEDTRRVTVDDAPMKLTPTEHALLVHLARTPDVVRSRAELLRDVFDTSHEGYARNVDCHVTRLRRKLETAGLDPAPIETVHGAGYRFLP